MPFPTSFPSISLFLCGASFALFTGCKEAPKLPPSVDSTSPAKTFSSYKNWDFGKKAYTHTKTIVDFGPRSIETEGHKKTQKYISDTLTALGWTVKPQQFETNTPYGKRTFTNYIARFQKDENNLSSPAILLAAHYDSKFLEG